MAVTDNTGDAVKILSSWVSPFVMRPQIALNLKSVNYELIPEEIFGPKSDLLKSNPVHKKMPVMIHFDNCICESLVIVEYIDEIWSSSASSIVPSDPYDRTTARFWAAYIDGSSFLALEWYPSMRTFLMAREQEAKQAAMDELKEGLVILEEAYVKTSKGKDFFNSDQVGYLDIALGCFLGWLKYVEVVTMVKLMDDVKTLGLVNWAEKFCADAAVKQVMPVTEKLLKFVMSVASAAD